MSKKSIWEASADPSLLDFSRLENISIKKAQIVGRILEVKRRELTPGEIRMLREDEGIIGKQIHYLPLELRVESRRPIEIIHFDLSPQYSVSPLHQGDVIRAYLWRYNDSFSKEAITIERKVGKEYKKIESYREGFGNLKPLQLRPESLLKRLD